MKVEMQISIKSGNGRRGRLKFSSKKNMIPKAIIPRRGYTEFDYHKISYYLVDQ